LESRKIHYACFIAPQHLLKDTKNYLDMHSCHRKARLY